MVGRAVEPPYFIDREDELAKVANGAGSLSENVLLMGQRRMGKSSLLHNAVKQIHKVYADVLVATMDCRRISSPEGFADALIYAVLEAYEAKHPAKGWVKLRARLFRDKITDLVPEIQKVGVKAVQEAFEGYLEFREKKIDPNEFLEKAFRFLGKFLKERDEDLVVILDEFQELEQTAGKRVFQLFKSYSDELVNARFVFSGSAIGILEDVFLKPNSPMYQMATKVPLGPLSAAYVTKFVADRLKTVSIAIDADAAAVVAECTGGIPYYVQKLGTQLWHKQLNDGTTHVTAKHVDDAFQDLLWECSSEFEARLEHKYGPVRKDILITLSKHGGPMRRADLARAINKPSGQISGALTNLEASMDIQRLERGQYEVSDPVFREWAKQRLK